MKKDKRQAINDMTDQELLKRLESIIKELVDVRMQLATGSLKNVHAGKELRKEMARIKTVLGMHAAIKVTTNNKA
jgi:ribosomal protein L29